MIDHRTEEFIQKFLGVLERIAQALEARQVSSQDVRNNPAGIPTTVATQQRDVLDMRKAPKEPKAGS